MRMEITTSVSCPNRCTFCPQELLDERYLGHSMMTLETIQKCFETIPEWVPVDFTGFSEPSINPEIHQIVSWLGTRGNPIKYYTTLLGIRDSIIDSIYACKAYVKIHVPDTVGFKFDPERWMKLHEVWRSRKYPADYMTMGPIHPMVAAYIESLGMKVLAPTMNSRGGNNWVVPRLDGPITCSRRRWNDNVLMPNGDVYLCCMDYGLTCKLGNLLTDPYKKILYEGDKYRDNHNLPEDAICRKCEWAETPWKP